MGNQYNTAQSQRKTILLYILANPSSTALQIATGSGIARVRVSQELSILKKDGMVMSERLEGESSSRWSKSDGHEVTTIEKPQQIVTRQWQGHPRDQWHQLFFGAAS